MDLRNAPLWQFFLEVLESDACSDIIVWVDRPDKFKILDPEGLTQLYASYAGKSFVKYESLIRRIRTYYENKAITKVPGERFLYSFGEAPKEFLANNILGSTKSKEGTDSPSPASPSPEHQAEHSSSSSDCLSHRDGPQDSSQSGRAAVPEDSNGIEKVGDSNVEIRVPVRRKAIRRSVKRKAGGSDNVIDKLVKLDTKVDENGDSTNSHRGLDAASIGDLLSEMSSYHQNEWRPTLTTPVASLLAKAVEPLLNRMLSVPCKGIPDLFRSGDKISPESQVASAAVLSKLMPLIGSAVDFSLSGSTSYGAGFSGRIPK